MPRKAGLQVGRGAVHGPGEEGLGEGAGPAAGADAHPGVLKPDYPQKRGIIAAGETRKTRKPVRQRRRRIRACQEQAADQGGRAEAPGDCNNRRKKLRELETTHDGVMGELEEFGVGPEDKTGENSSCYLTSMARP